MFTLTNQKVFIAGHRGMVGRALTRRLEEESCELVTIEREALDLKDQYGVQKFFETERPDVVVVAAAKVGGILANSTSPADFLYDNLVIASNIIEAAHRNSVEKLLYLGSSCIYPKFSPQPIPEEALLTGPLEPTNEWYAIAKIAGLKLCEAYRRQYGVDYISAMPTNLYGPGDNFHLENSHVIPALMRKAHDAKLAGRQGIEIWGSGEPRREFLHVDDCADALVFLLKNYSGNQHVNVGSGTDVTIAELAHLVMEAVGLDGELTRDMSKPDGTPRKLMSGKKLAEMGWRPNISLKEGLKSTYRWFLENYESADMRV